MKISILKNDAFVVLSKSTGIGFDNLEKTIIDSLIEEHMMSGDANDCGVSVEQIRVQNNYDISDIIEVIFGENENKEIPELLKEIYIWGDGSEHPCPLCGCECEGTEDGAHGSVWMDWECSNGECDFTDSGEPDWDVLPGGYAFKSEN